MQPYDSIATGLFLSATLVTLAATGYSYLVLGRSGQVRRVTHESNGVVTVFGAVQIGEVGDKI